MYHSCRYCDDLEALLLTDSLKKQLSEKWTDVNNFGSRNLAKAGMNLPNEPEKCHVPHGEMAWFDITTRRLPTIQIRAHCRHDQRMK